MMDNPLEVVLKEHIKLVDSVDDDHPMMQGFQHGWDFTKLQPYSKQLLLLTVLILLSMLFSTDN